MATKIVDRFVPLLARAFPLLEPFVPRYISANMRRRLKKLKQRGLILDYKTRTRRLGKLHYKFAVDVDLTKEQTVMFLRELLDQGGRTVGTDLKEVIVWLKRRKAM